ncbi:hypothetical protein DYH09_35665, partial [bacterium CPR1]|nr:hypothetical protein [bacterium CPR1]
MLVGMEIRGFNPLQQPGWSLPQTASGGSRPDSVHLSSGAGWTPMRPVAAAGRGPEKPSGKSLARTASEVLQRLGLGWLTPDQATRPPGQSELPESQARRSRLTESVREGLVALTKHGRPAGAPEGQSGSVTTEQALENLRSGKGAYLSADVYCYNVKSLDEAGFFLFMLGLGSEAELERPELARSLKWLTEKELCFDGALHKELPLSLYRDLKDPERSVQIQTPDRDRRKGLALGIFSGVQMEPMEAFQEQLAPSLAAAALAERYQGSRDQIWSQIHHSELNHHGAGIEQRAQ